MCFCALFTVRVRNVTIQKKKKKELLGRNLSRLRFRMYMVWNAQKCGQHVCMALVMIEHPGRAFKKVLQVRCDSAMPCATVQSCVQTPLDNSHIERSPATLLTKDSANTVGSMAPYCLSWMVHVWHGHWEFLQSIFNSTSKPLNLQSPTPLLSNNSFQKKEYNQLSQISTTPYMFFLSQVISFVVAELTQSTAPVVLPYQILIVYNAQGQITLKKGCGQVHQPPKWRQNTWCHWCSLGIEHMPSNWAPGTKLTPFQLK
jgi:hypothetical protein